MESLKGLNGPVLSKQPFFVVEDHAKIFTLTLVWGLKNLAS